MKNKGNAMDERQFQQALKQTLNEEIQNVELWQQIEGKLPNQPVRTGLRLGKAAFIVLLLTMTAVVAYALYQGVVVPGDPGISSMQAADRLTYYGATQSLGGDHNLTVTLDYA